MLTDFVVRLTLCATMVIVFVGAAPQMSRNGRLGGRDIMAAYDSGFEIYNSGDQYEPIGNLAPDAIQSRTFGGLGGGGGLLGGGSGGLLGGGGFLRILANLLGFGGNRQANVGSGQYPASMLGPYPGYPPGGFGGYPYVGYGVGYPPVFG